MILRIALYLIFIFCAAPIDSVLFFWSGYVKSDKLQLLRPFADALIYIYAFVLSAETLFRIEQHHDILALKVWLRLPQFASGVVIFFFFIDYVSVLRPDVLAGKSAVESLQRQILFATIAVVASIGSFAACEREKRPTIRVPTAAGPKAAPKRTGGP